MILIEVYQDTDGKWHWRCRHVVHDEIIANSAVGYETRDECEDMITQLRMDFANAPIVDPE